MIFGTLYVQEFLFFRFGRDEDNDWGLFMNDFATIRDSWRLEELQEIMPILSGNIGRK